MNVLVNNRIPSLDGLRTISVALVVLSHFLPMVGAYSTWNVGLLGVKFFFVISGFLITGLLLKEIDKTATVNLTKFYFRRTLRIFPPYYFYLFVLFLAVKFDVVSFTDSFRPALTYTSNYFVADTWYLLHTWSLSVEEQFYLIFPFVLLLFGRRRIAWLLVALIAVSPALRLLDYQYYSEAGKMWIYYGFHANADGLATGCLLAVFYERLHKNEFYLRLLNSRLMIAVPLLVVVVNSYIDPRRFYLGASFTISNLLIALCIDWAITNYRSNPVGRFLNTAPMERIGVMSYSIYLWQQPFLNHDTVLWFNRFPYNFIGIAVFSSLSYFAIERFSLRWRAQIEKKLFKPKPLQEKLSPVEITVS
ncbi:MAG: acyltransferase [Acidobacteria bacterium]|nr:acyltransferase [Acidobacteriota bacterium]